MVGSLSHTPNGFGFDPWGTYGRQPIHMSIFLSHVDVSLPPPPTTLSLSLSLKPMEIYPWEGLKKYIFYIKQNILIQKALEHYFELTLLQVHIRNWMREEMGDKDTKKEADSIKDKKMEIRKKIYKYQAVCRKSCYLSSRFTTPSWQKRPLKKRTASVQSIVVM